MHTEELLHRLKRLEDNWTERKLGSKPSELRETIVAFANSVSGGPPAVLFVGVANDGKVQGIGRNGSESLQKTIRQICERDCYPPIKSVKFCVLPVEDKSVLAVMVHSSDNRPHFSGPAYVRVGAENITASKEMFEELIASRLEKPRAIVALKGQVITVQTVGKILGDTEVLGPNFRKSYDCRVEESTPHHVTFTDLRTDKRLNEPLSYVEVAHDTERNRPMLIIEKPR